MDIKETAFSGVYEIYPKFYADDRGWFCETYKNLSLKEAGIEYSFVQENQSFSKRGVIRGLHLQEGDYAQAKLVSCLQGKILDVVVDLRPASQTYLKVLSVILDSRRRNMLIIPKGFAHGFAALRDSIVHYKCSDVYNQSSESGIVWNDPELNIDWMVDNPLVSGKDKQLPTLAEYVNQVLC